VGFENNFNGTTFHHHFCLKTGVSRNGLSLEYSERDTSAVIAKRKEVKKDKINKHSPL
jgi:hypothetical protein